MKSEEDWNAVERRLTACERKAPSPSPEPETECGRNHLQQNVKKCQIMNCDKLGGLAKCSEENLVDNPTIEHIANHCCVHCASHRIDCEIEAELSSKTVACLTELDKSSLHQFAQVFKAAGEKNPNILPHEEAQRDCNDLKEWLATAPKEIKQLERKGVWTECLKSEAKGEQIIPCTWAF